MRAVAIALVLFGFLQLATAQDVVIGRSTLKLGQADKWQVRDLDDIGAGYSGGEANGSIAVEKKGLLLNSTEGLIKVSGVVRVTKGGAPVRLAWSNYCPDVKTNDYVHKLDKGGTSYVDCLVITRVVNMAGFAQRFAALDPAIKARLPQSAGGYYIDYMKTMDAGGFFSAKFLVAGDIVVDASQTPPSPQIPASVMSWAMKLAASGRDAIGSFSGNWSLIAPAFQ